MTVPEGVRFGGIPMKSLFFLLMILLGAALIAPGSGNAPRSASALNAPLVVTTLADSGPGSLQAAISAANSTAGPDTITFGIGVNGTISVLNSLNIQDEGTTIDATGHEIIVDGSPAPTPNNIFQVAATSATFIGFTVQNAKSNGISVSPAFNGGCVGTIANLTLTRMTLQQNTGESGLLLCAASASNVVINDSEFLGNRRGVSLRAGVAGGTNIHNSRFVGNAVAAVAVDAGTGGTVNAQQNWWGCAAGPPNAGCDSVSANVDSSNFNTVDAIRVTNLTDSGDGSLRRAVDEANTLPGPDTIRFALSGTIALAGGGMPLTDEGTTIDATGRSIIIDGSGMSPLSNIFQVSANSAGFLGFTIQHAKSNAISFDNLTCSTSGLAATVHAMTLRDNVENGLNLCVSSFATTSITDNRFISNYAGIGVAPGSAAVLSAHGNSFTGNQWGVVNFGVGNVDAAANWWGCNAGPGNPGCDGVSGNVVTDSYIHNQLEVSSLLDDDSPGTLRWAIGQANSTPGQDVISFVVDGTITLNGPLVIDDGSTIVDAGSRSITVAPSGTFAAFEIRADDAWLVGVTVNGGTGISVKGGNCDGLLDSLTIDRVTVTGSTGQSLNICARSVKNVSIQNSSFIGSMNTAVQICHCDPLNTTLDVTDVEVLSTTIVGGKAGLVLGNGGTDPVTLARLNIENSTITGTAASGAPGGGFSYTGGPLLAMDVNVTSSTFNSAPGAAAFGIEANGSVGGAGFEVVGNHFSNSVVFSGATGGALSGFTVQGNTITAPTGRPGIQIAVSNGSVSNVSITGNPSVAGGLAGILIGSPFGGSSVVSDVRITDNGPIQGTGSVRSGIAFFGVTQLTASDITIERNASITGGAEGTGVFIGSFDGGVTVDGVSISNNGSITGGLAGISVGNTAANAVINGLAINSHAELRATAPGGAAIDYRGLSSSGGNTISDNVISGSSIGIKLANGAAGSAMHLGIVGNQFLGNGTNAGVGVQVLTGAGANVDIHLNSFLGNGIGLQTVDTGTATTSEWNWWGCIAGPGTPGCTSIAEDFTGSVTFSPWLQAPITSARTSATVSTSGTSASASVLPDGTTTTGATAAVTADGTTPTTVTVSTYESNPATTVFDTGGGGFVDIYLSDPAAVTTVTSSFYYPSSVTGQAETDLVLMYFAEAQWVPVLGGGGVAPIKDMTDNLDGTVSGGRFTVTFGTDSTPQAAQLNGTIVSISATAPSVRQVTGSSGPVMEGTLATVSASFSDFGLSETHTATIDWDDGSTASVIPLAAGVTDLSAEHTYAEPGVYTVTVTVTDSAHQSGSSALRYIVVYDPTAGFVTGGGWFNSPAGSCQLSALCAGVVGKAEFGFVSRYKKGATVPTGETEFQFDAGKLKFKSTSYLWLVVNGHKAQYRGFGTINGAGNYAFILTAIDGKLTGPGSPDKFRIKITKLDGTVVYDNKLGEDEAGDASTELGGGSIVIHK
ncbi:MAG: PKD domain-containing protein [Anaerolineaceae bacterium]